MSKKSAKEKARFEVRRSEIHGTGVFAIKRIAAETEIIEYTGKRISHSKADRLYAGGADSGHTFLFTLNEKYIIDANVDGSDARWINTSCAPNCIACVIETDTDDPKEDRVVIESLRAIKPGEELTYDYGIVLEQRHTKKMKKLWQCRCGAPDCSGTMLRPKKG
jgi:hypothetical protein